jgi:predicted ATPase
MDTSLLRGVSEFQVRHRFNRLAHGNVALSDFDFTYTFAGNEPPKITFKVTPASEPPTNVHVLIGRNGVGKTRCLTNLVKSILDPESAAALDGQISAVISDKQETSFSGVVVVAFSAFDEFKLPERIRNGIHAHHIGIPAAQAQVHEANQDGNAPTFNEAFMQSFERCMGGPRRRRILDAVTTLENDPLFAEANLSALLNEGHADAAQSATELFKKMSSGHKIVLLTVTRLVELVDERTLVLLDEPEGHLHPPLLSAFVRALSDLLIKRNGVAMISTHSPVVLQEVPRSCVWVLWRSGRESRVSRPELETFGENVGILTREIFGLEVTNSGFHQVLKAATLAPEATFESVMAKFGNQLGAEAQAIVRSMLAIKANEGRR